MYPDNSHKVFLKINDYIRTQCCTQIWSLLFKRKLILFNYFIKMLSKRENGSLICFLEQSFAFIITIHSLIHGANMILLNIT